MLILLYAVDDDMNRSSRIHAVQKNLAIRVKRQRET